MGNPASSNGRTPPFEGVNRGSNPWVGASVIVGGIRIEVSHKLEKAIEHAISVATIELAKLWPDKLGDEYRKAAKNVIAAYVSHERQL